MMQPFLDYYAEHDISPVKQNREGLFERRAALYHLLGIPPAYVHNRRVLEFGPGSGDNALYTMSLGPSEYIFVEPNPRGIRETRETLRAAGYPTVQIIQCRVDQFTQDAGFDLVLAENLIPFQLDPAAFLRHIARTVKPGGLLVITCDSAASFLSTTCRCLIANRIAPPSLPFEDRIAIVSSFFAPHLATLEGMSRSVDDWVIDNLLQPRIGKPLAMFEAIEALDAEFDFYNSSPSFSQDWRWYKELGGKKSSFNQRAITFSLRNTLNFMDCREELREHPADFGRQLERRCGKIFEIAQSPDGYASYALSILADEILPKSLRTATSIQGVIEFLHSGALPPWSFASFFGRTQYVSFVRRPQ